MFLYSIARQKLRNTVIFGTVILIASLASISHAAPVIPTLPLMYLEARDQHDQLRPISPLYQAMFDYFEQDMGVKFEIRRYPWTRLLQHAENGDGLVWAMTKNQERLRIFHYSQPIFRRYVWIATRSDASFKFASLADLKGKTLGLVRGASYGDDFDQQKGKLFQVEEDVAAPAARMKKLINKRMDVMLFSHRYTTASAVQAYLNAEAKNLHLDLPPGVSFSILSKPLLVDDMYFAIRADQDDGIINTINASIARGKRSGEIARLTK
ncbi:MAG: transporter substrate-binding domain-containing protein [Burkholderiales bacterium]|nr:transporter substrate-binding domain-containing protein [Burkholderiales bacterium]